MLPELALNFLSPQVFLYSRCWNSVPVTQRCLCRDSSPSHSHGSAVLIFRMYLSGHPTRPSPVVVHARIVPSGGLDYSLRLAGTVRQAFLNVRVCVGL